MSVLRAVRKRKKVRKLGSVTIIRREAYADLELDAKVELIRSLVPLGLMHVQELLDQEVTALASERYARKDASVGGRRHGSNPGTVGLAGQRVPIRVPRIRRLAGSEIPLRSYEALHGDREVDDVLLRRVLYGISCRNYEAAAEAIPGAIGLSSSTVSRGFIQASAAQLRAFQERDLSGEDVVAVFLDGKTFADATMVIALGITLAGGVWFSCWTLLVTPHWSRRADGFSQGTQYQFDGRSPSIAGGQRSELDDVVTALLLPTRAAALEAEFKEALAGRLDVAAPEGQPAPAGPGVVHAVGVLAMALQVGDRGMHGMVVAGAFIQTTGHQFREDVGGRRAPVEERQLPASAPRGCLRRAIKDTRGRAQLLQDVREIDQPMDPRA